MNSIDITAIIEAVIALAAAVITTFLVPWLKAKLGREKSEALGFWVRTAVRAAEQLYGSKSGQEKKRYVLELLGEKGIQVDDAVIEAAVSELFGKASFFAGDGSTAGEY